MTQPGINPDSAQQVSLTSANLSVPVGCPSELPRIDIARLGPSAARVLEFARAGLPHVMTVGAVSPAGPAVSYESAVASELLSLGAIPFRSLAMRNSWQNRFPQSPEFYAAYFAQWLPTVDAVLALPAQDNTSTALLRLAEELSIPILRDPKVAADLFGRRDLTLGVDFEKIAGALYSILQVPPTRELDQDETSRLAAIGREALALRLPRIYVAGPYSSDEHRGTLKAFAYGTQIASVACPLIPHYTHDWDSGISLPYEVWLCLDACILPKVEFGARLAGRSSGADGEIAVLQHLGRPAYDAHEYAGFLRRSGASAGRLGVAVDGDCAASL